MILEEVERVTKAAVAAPTKPIPKFKPKVVESSDEEEPPEPKDAEDSMYVDDEPAEVKPKRSRKKAEKKSVPVGKNGLKKKRAVKSRKSMDERGYMGRRCVLSPTHDPVAENFALSERGLFLVRIGRRRGRGTRRARETKKEASLQTLRI